MIRILRDNFIPPCDFFFIRAKIETNKYIFFSPESEEDIFIVCIGSHVTAPPTLFIISRNREVFIIERRGMIVISKCK